MKVALIFFCILVAVATAAPSRFRNRRGAASLAESEADNRSVGFDTPLGKLGVYGSSSSARAKAVAVDDPHGDLSQTGFKRERKLPHPILNPIGTAYELASRVAG
ncbi:uncharacterized protein LOC125501707 [Athalia rosae]|uniref:uncharacterized protein LOC125501707 n=1 Tax=Athalia rosae TaxID=37344 RepID=UPI002033A75E|nr:uncharacterized protein LOC125501707 [Athalia rosae]